MFSTLLDRQRAFWFRHALHAWQVLAGAAFPRVAIPAQSVLQQLIVCGFGLGPYSHGQAVHYESMGFRLCRSI
jgi:hypothetical protein